MVSLDYMELIRTNYIYISNAKAKSCLCSSSIVDLGSGLRVFFRPKGMLVGYLTGWLLKRPDIKRSKKFHFQYFWKIPISRNVWLLSITIIELLMGTCVCDLSKTIYFKSGQEACCNLFSCQLINMSSSFRFLAKNYLFVGFCGLTCYHLSKVEEC